MSGIPSREVGGFARVTATRLVESGLPDAQFGLSVARMRCGNPDPDHEIPFGGMDADIAQLHLRSSPGYEYTRAGRASQMLPRSAMEAALQDPRIPGVSRLTQPIDLLNFYIPCAALIRIAEDAENSRVCGLKFEAGANPPDQVIRHLGEAILPAMAAPECASALFVDHILQAVCLYMATTYGGLQLRQAMRRGGLATWQENRAKELMSAELGCDLPMAMLAKECGLSATHFARAFRASTGKSPHSWQMERRLDRSMSLLRRARPSLAEVALACGFADQSHFTRVFSNYMGVSPGRWRKTFQAGPADGPDGMDDSTDAVSGPNRQNAC